MSPTTPQDPSPLPLAPTTTATDQQTEPYTPYHRTPTRQTVSRYLYTRITSLKPPMNKVENPFTLLGLLSRKQWMFVLLGYAGWTWDAFDFFTVSLTVSDLALQFNRSNADITWGITLVLMFRSPGAIIFGILSDRYGRKWPFILNCILFIAFELGTGFTQTYPQFLACRALFGVAMGGLYGNAAATALEDCPPRARGLIGGIFQQGYSLGYLLATVFARGLVNTTSHGWRPLFWFGACPPILLIIFRLCLPETDTFLERKAVRESHSGQAVSKTFLREGRVAMRKHWILLVYLVLLMTGLNFSSHGSADLYPTLLSNQYNYSPNAVTVTQVVANLGAMTGGMTMGYASEIFGRRLCIILLSFVGGILLWPYCFTSSHAVIAAAFFQQFCVQGVWGIVPSHLMELSPGSIRTFVVGASYQVGNLISSASTTIEATAGEHFPLPPKGKVSRYQYGLVIAIVMAAVFTYDIILTFLGPENLNRSFKVEFDDDLMEVTGAKRSELVLMARGEDIERVESADEEKVRVEHVEV